jgi:hypothetical protein
VPSAPPIRLRLWRWINSILTYLLSAMGAGRVLKVGGAHRAMGAGRVSKVGGHSVQTYQKWGGTCPPVPHGVGAYELVPRIN